MSRCQLAHIDILSGRNRGANESLLLQKNKCSCLVGLEWLEWLEWFGLNVFKHFCSKLVLEDSLFLHGIERQMNVRLKIMLLPR